MTVPEALQDKTLRRYRLRRHRLHCAGGELSVVAPARADDLLEDGRADECLRRRQIPYWADIWPASVGMARHLMRGPSLAGRRVMDLGCGIGIAGLAAASRGARVHFVDLSAEALRFAAFNARNLPADRSTFEELDWFKSTVVGRFDLILLADVSYEERNHEPLQRHLRSCLRESGYCLHSDPFRAASQHFLDRVGSGFMASMGFTASILRTSTSFGGTRFDLRLATIRHALDPRAGSPPLVPHA